MYLCVPVVCVFLGGFVSAGIEMTLSKYNTSTLIRHANTTFDLQCSSDNKRAALQITCCKSSRDCKTITEVDRLDSNLTIAVKFQSLQTTDTGTYICQDLHSGEETYTKLIVGVEPEEPESMHCVSQDWMVCTWKKSETQITNAVPTSWEISFGWKPQNASNFTQAAACPSQNDTTSSISCRWNSIGLMREYRVTVSGRNQLGSATKVYRINPKDYVLLTIPKLKIKPYAKSLLIAWELPEYVYLSLVGSVVFEMTLHGPISKATMLWNITIKEEYEKNFTDLHPFTQYKFCIRTRLLDSGHWGDTVCRKAITEKAVPTHAPETSQWAYFVDENNRSLKLYLKEIPPFYRTSIKYNYCIQWLERGSITFNKTVSPNATIDVQAPLLWTDSADPVQTVRIRPCNEMGCSDNFTQVDIDKTRKDFRPHRVTVAKETENEQYTVSCDVREEFLGDIQYIVFYYCRGFRENHICLTNFSWIVETDINLQRTIKVPSGQYGDWMFGVSLVAHDNSSGGIFYSTCYSSGNNSCEHVSIRKEESSTADEVITVLLMFLVLVFILTTVLLLRYLRQKYCEDIRIDLPEIFQKKYNMNGTTRPEAETMINPDSDQSSSFDAMHVYNDCNDVLHHSCRQGVNICHNEKDSKFGCGDVIYSRNFDTVYNDKKQSSLTPITTVLPQCDSAVLPGSDATVQYDSDVTLLPGSDVTVVSESNDTVQYEFDETVLSESGGKKLDNKSIQQNRNDLDEIFENEVSQTGSKENCIKYDVKFKFRGKIEDKNSDFSVLMNNDDSSAYAKMTGTFCYTQSDQPQDYVTWDEVMNC